MKEASFSKTPSNVATNFTLTIPNDVYEKIMYWVNKADFEVSGFGSLDYDEKTNDFTVRDVILLEQEVSGASTEINPIAINRAMFQMRDEPNALKWHWHSHVKMGVFWSSDDMELIRQLGQQGWIVASVFNQREEVKTSFLTTTEVFGKPHDIFVDNLPTFIEQKEISPDLKKQLDEEYNAMVKEMTNVMYAKGRTHYPSYQMDYDWDALSKMDDDELSELIAKESELYYAPKQKLSVKRSDFDKYGLAKVNGDVFYCPIFDTGVQTEEQLMIEIDNMFPEDIELMKETFPNFRKALTRYVALKAKMDSSKTVNKTIQELQVEAQKGKGNGSKSSNQTA